MVYLDPGDLDLVATGTDPVVPSDFQYPDEAGDAPDHSIADEVDGTLFETDEMRDLVHRAIRFGLSSKERDIFELYYFRGKTQEQIGRMLNLAQRTVGYRLAKGMERIRYFLFIDSLDFDDFRDAVNEALSQTMRGDELTLYVNIVIGVVTTSSQSVVGELLGLNQSMVRWRFFKSLEAMERESPDRPRLQRYVNVLHLVRDRFSILGKDRLSQRTSFVS